jgi:hypothetical protein
MFMVWANFHGGFFIGFAYLLYRLIKDRDWQWLGILLASILASFINPYGPRLYVEIIATLTDSQVHWQVKEWTPFLIFWATQPFVALWLAGVILYTKRPFKKWFTFDKLLFAAGLQSTRHIPLFVMTSTGPIDDYLQQTKAALPKKPKVSVKVVLAILVMLVAADVGYGVYAAFFNMSPREAIYPSQEAHYLVEHPCKGNTFNTYDIGGYLTWKVPGKKIYIDGRMPIWHDQHGKKYIDAYFKIFSDDKIRKQQFTKYDIKCAVIGAGMDSGKLADALKKSGWKQKANSKYSILLEAPKSE